jgi:hypothetical protein
MSKQPRLLLLAVLAVELVVASAAARNPPVIKGPMPPQWDRATAKFGMELVDVPNDGTGKQSPIWWGASGAILPPRRMLFRPSSHAAFGAGNDTSGQLPGHLGRPQILNVPTSPIFKYTADASPNTPGQEVEPYLVSANYGGTTYTPVVYSHWDGSHFRTYWSTFSSLIAGSSTPVSGGLFAIGASYNESFDQTLAANPYTDGVRPGAVYAQFCDGFRTGNNTIANPMQVQICGSNDGGQTWADCSTTAYTLTGDNYTLDRPVLDVSWFPGTRGYIYAAWTEVQAAGVTRIMLRRNTGGLAQFCHPVGGGCTTTWETPVVIADYALNENPVVPQVVVNPNNGDVYVFWYNNQGQLRMNRQTYVTGQASDPWSGPITVVQGMHRITVNQGYLPNGLRALINPDIHYNPVNQNVMAVWHDRPQDEVPNDTSNQTRLDYVAFNGSTITGPVVQSFINNDTGTNMQPAIDNDDSGNMFIGYFATRGSTTTYQLYGLCLWPWGALGCSPTALDAGPWTNGFIGDYHAMFFWTFLDGVGSRFNTSWSANGGSSNWDARVTGVQ